MTKEEAYKKHGDLSDRDFWWCCDDEIDAAMDEYAKEQSIAFQVWVAENYKEVPSPYAYRWYVSSIIFITVVDLTAAEHFTIEQLYELFIKSTTT